MKKLLNILLTAFILLSICSCNTNSNNEYSFEYWNKESASLKTLIEYIDDIINENSANYIPPEDRIAVFDMDGTLYKETMPVYFENLLFLYRVFDDPTYKASKEMIEYGEFIKQEIENGSNYIEDLNFSKYNALAFEDMPMEEFENYVIKFANETDVSNEEPGRKYADAWFLPMLEIIDYLNENQFKTFICSGTDRQTCRALTKGNVNILSEHIIGADINFKPSTYKGSLQDEYEFTKDDTLIRSSEFINENLKGDKVNQIQRQIGKQPVLVFGNSSGDLSMGLYATTNNKYKSLAFMVSHDDPERSFSPERVYEEREKVWNEVGFNIISMKNDFLKIYKWEK